MAWMPAASRNFSAFRCVALPWPADAKFMLPGLALAAASKSCKVLMPLLGEITKALGVELMGVTPANAVKVSKGSLAKVLGLTVCDDEWTMMV